MAHLCVCCAREWEVRTLLISHYSSRGGKDHELLLVFAKWLDVGVRTKNSSCVADRWTFWLTHGYFRNAEAAPRTSNSRELMLVVREGVGGWIKAKTNIRRSTADTETSCREIQGMVIHVDLIGAIWIFCVIVSCSFVSIVQIGDMNAQKVVNRCWHFTEVRCDRLCGSPSTSRFYLFFLIIQVIIVRFRFLTWWIMSTMTGQIKKEKKSP